MQSSCHEFTDKFAAIQQLALFRTNQPPPAIHLTKHKFTRHVSRTNKVIRKCAKAVGFLSVLAKDAFTHLELLQRHDMASKSEFL